MQCNLVDCKLEGDHELEDHLNWRPGEDCKSPCPVDGCAFRNDKRSQMRRHLCVKHCGKLHTCAICNREFTSTSVLNRHKDNIHKGPVKTFPCTVCGKIFSVERYMTTHRLRHGQGQSPRHARGQSPPPPYTPRSPPLVIDPKLKEMTARAVQQAIQETLRKQIAKESKTDTDAHAQILVDLAESHHQLPPEEYAIELQDSGPISGDSNAMLQLHIVIPTAPVEIEPQDAISPLHVETEIEPKSAWMCSSTYPEGIDLDKW